MANNWVALTIVRALYIVFYLFVMTCQILNDGPTNYCGNKGTDPLSIEGGGQSALDLRNGEQIKDDRPRMDSQVRQREPGGR